MKNEIDFSSFDEKKKIIKTELIGIIDDLEKFQIPNRDLAIKQFYLDDLENLPQLGKEIKKGVQSLHKVNNKGPSNEKSKKEMIYSLLEQISDNKKSNNNILKQIFKLIDKISEEDKSVLMMTLDGSEPEEIKKSLNDILQAFCTD